MSDNRKPYTPRKFITLEKRIGENKRLRYAPVVKQLEALFYDRRRLVEQLIEIDRKLDSEAKRLAAAEELLQIVEDRKTLSENAATFLARDLGINYQQD